MKFLRENISSKLCDIALSNILLDMSLHAREKKQKEKKQTNGTTSNKKFFSQ